MTISLKTQVPDIDTYLRLRVDSGLSGYGRDAAEIGLKNSLFCVMLLTAMKRSVWGVSSVTAAVLSR